MWYWYITWHGGFSASFADALLGFLGESGPAIMVPLSILSWVLSLTWAISSFLSNRRLDQNRSVAVLMALMVLYGTLITSPQTLTSIIWWGGLRGYIPPLIIMPLYIGLYNVFSRKDWPVGKRHIWYMFSFAIIFFNGGFSENFTPLQLIILACILAVELYVNQRTLKSQKSIFLLTGILGGILALVLMVLAPGNANRQALYPAPASPLMIMFIALQSYVNLWKGLFLDPQKIVTLVAVFSGSMFLGTLLSNRIGINSRISLMVMITGLLFAYCCFLPAAYGQSTGPSETSLIVPMYILVLTFAITGLLCGASLPNIDTEQPHGRYVLVLSLVLFVSLGYSTIVNLQHLRTQITQATVYGENWEMRDQQIRRARLDGVKKIVISSMPGWITQEPTENPRFFVNHCMALYYGAESLSTVNPDE